MVEEHSEVITDATPEEDVAAPSLSRSFGIRSWLQEALETLLLAGILILIVNTLTGRYQVHGQSMEPSLHNGQYLIASKVSYWLHPPQRGDVIVLDPPASEERDVPYTFIKRLIGLPGDVVEVRENRVWVNGVAINEPYINAPPNYTGNWVLADEEYLAFGDNRNNSSDSHSWGLLSRDHILGKAIFCYWPPENWGAIPHYVFPELEDVQ